MVKMSASKKSKSNVVTASYIKNKTRREELHVQAKREREGRKLGPILLENQFRDKYGLIKWDLLLNFLILATYFWAQDLIFLALVVFLQVYVASYFIFNYRKYRLAPFLMSLSIIPFSVYLLYPDLDALFRSALFFCGWAILTYGIFWFLIIFKNRKEFQNAQEMELCLECNTQKPNFVIHMGRYLCKDCFLEQAYNLKNFNGIEIYSWDRDVLSYLEHEIGEKILNFNLSEDNDILKSEIENKLFFSVEENNVIAISIPNKNLKLNLPEEIGLIQSLRILNFPGNQISKLPYSMRDLFHLKILNLKNNHLEYLPGHSLKTLTFLKRRGCNILR